MMFVGVDVEEDWVELENWGFCLVQWRKSVQDRGEESNPLTLLIFSFCFFLVKQTKL
jgi:hypothetical protein